MKPGFMIGQIWGSDVSEQNICEMFGVHRVEIIRQGEVFETDLKPDRVRVWLDDDNRISLIAHEPREGGMVRFDCPEGFEDHVIGDEQ